MQENSQILEAVGGLEAAKRIVDDAPDGAEYFLAETQIYFKSKNPLLYWSGRKSIWETCDWGNIERAADFHSEPYINLSSMRAAIDQAETAQRMTEPNQAVAQAKQALSTFKAPELTGFKVGDLVVWSKDEWENLWKVISDECEGQFDLESNDKIWHVGADTEDLRHATPAEIQAGHRIDAPEINIDADFNPDSRHISPACHVSDFTGLPKPKPAKPLYTPLELELMHKIEHLQCSRNFYRVACAGLVAVAFCVWVGWLS